MQRSCVDGATIALIAVQATEANQISPKNGHQNANPRLLDYYCGAPNSSLPRNTQSMLRPNISAPYLRGRASIAGINRGRVESHPPTAFAHPQLASGRGNEPRVVRDQHDPALVLLNALDQRVNALHVTCNTFTGGYGGKARG